MNSMLRLRRKTNESLEQWKFRLVIDGVSEASETLMERNRTSAEAVYWKLTNNLRRNLLMTAARDLLLDEWDVPFPNDTEAQGNVLALRPVAEKALLDRVTYHITYNLTPPDSPESTPLDYYPDY